MKKTSKKQSNRAIRHKRVRAKIFGTAKRPRLSVFRSSKHIYAQLIDDENAQTLISVSSLDFKKRKKSPKEIAYDIGKKLADLVSQKNLKKIVFDRNGYKFHGRIQEFAKGARDGGLVF